MSQTLLNDVGVCGCVGVWVCDDLLSHTDTHNVDTMFTHMCTHKIDTIYTLMFMGLFHGAHTGRDDCAHKCVRGADDGAHSMVHTLWKRAGICRVSTQRMVGGGAAGGVADSALSSLSSNLGPKKPLPSSDFGVGGGLNLNKKGPLPSAVRSYPKP
jgi:hypothetical protein